MPRVTDPAMRPAGAEHQRSGLSNRSSSGAQKQHDIEADEDYDQQLKDDILNEKEDHQGCESANFFKKNHKLVIIVGLLLIILIVVIIWYVMQKNKNSEEEQMRQHQARRIQQRNEMMQHGMFPQGQQPPMMFQPMQQNTANHMQNESNKSNFSDSTAKNTNLPPNTNLIHPGIQCAPGQSLTPAKETKKKTKEEERENIDNLLSQTSNLLDNEEKKSDDPDAETEEDRKLVEKFTQQLVDDQEDL